MTLAQIHHTDHAATETFAVMGVAGGVALCATRHDSEATRTIDIPDAIVPWMIANLARRLPPASQESSVSGRLRTIAEAHPGVLADLYPLASIVARMEAQLDDIVADACEAEMARVVRPRGKGRRGWFRVVRGELA